MLTNEKIEQFASDWYKKLDVHAPMVDILPMLDDEELVMVFPEGTFYGWKGFEGWYQKVIRVYFNEVHTLKSVVPTISGDKATVKVVVYWEASIWKPPKASTQRIMMDAYQTWEIKASGENILLTKYEVDNMTYKEGSTKL